MARRAQDVSLLYVLGSLVLIIACLYWAKAVFIPIALALLLTFLLNPVVGKLHSLGLPRTPAVLVVVVLVFSLMGGFGWTVMRQLATLAYELPRYQENLRQKVNDLRELGTSPVFERVLTTIKEVTSELQTAQRPKSEPVIMGEPKVVPEEPGEKPIPVVVQTPSVLWQLPSVLESLATAGLVIVLLIFMLIRYTDLRGRLLYLAGYDRLTIATKAIDEAGQRISRYLLMQSIINGSFGFAAGLGFVLIGVPYAILWGFLAATLRFIPYLGPPIAAILPSALSLAVFPGWALPLLVIGLIVILELASNMIMEPLLYGQSAGVSEVALLIAVAFWTWLWGPVGLILATPLTVCLGVLGKHVPQIGFIGVLLGDEAVLESPTSYYQRLVAHDQDEAAALVEEYLQTHTREALYDDVLIPALSAAKRDSELGALTEEDMQFILHATRAIVEDLGTRQPQPSIASLMTTATAPEKSGVTRPLRILGRPAHDAVDELALLMFQQLLDPTQYTMTIVSAEMLSAEVLSAMEEHHIRLICIAALPPAAIAPTRYLCKRLRARFPDCKIVVGRWGLEEDNSDKPQQFLQEAGADEVGTTLHETHNQVRHLSQLVSALETPSSLASAAERSPSESSAMQL
jgi:predicted PurR-regulated permease PerM